MKRILCIFSILIILNGCGTAGRFITTSNKEAKITRSIYPATSIDAHLMGMGDPIITFLSLLDLPISLTVDTIFLPYDIGMYSYNSSYINYWEDLSNNKKINIPIDDSMEYYDETGSIALLYVSKSYPDEALFKYYFDVVSANNNDQLTANHQLIKNIIFRAFESGIYESEGSTKYKTLREHICREISSNPNNKNYTYARKNNYIQGCI